MPAFLLLLLLLLLLRPSAAAAAALNITLLLSQLPSFSLLNKLLSSTSVSEEINARSSITLLSPNDTAIATLLATFDGGGIPAQQMADTLRYHVLLEYMDVAAMEQRAGMAEEQQRRVTTLYQTTGRAQGESGWVSLQPLPGGGGVSLATTGGAPPSAAVLPIPLRLFPYNLSVLQIDRVLVPPLLAARAPPPPAPPPVDIVGALERAARFSTFLAFLGATGVDVTFADCESREGITIFAPADEAFAAIPASSSLQKLTAQQKILVLEYHALNTYYALGTLAEFRNPAAPTVATSDPRSGGAGQFTVNITSVGGVFTLDTGVVSAPVVATLLEQQPVSIFVINKVLLPMSIFGGGQGGQTPPPPPPALALPPAEPPPLPASPPPPKAEVMYYPPPNSVARSGTPPATSPQPLSLSSSGLSKMKKKNQMLLLILLLLFLVHHI